VVVGAVPAVPVVSVVEVEVLSPVVVDVDVEVVSASVAEAAVVASSPLQAARTRVRRVGVASDRDLSVITIIVSGRWIEARSSRSTNRSEPRVVAAHSWWTDGRLATAGRRRRGRCR
jgi:hypothetical protein